MFYTLDLSRADDTDIRLTYEAGDVKSFWSECGRAFPNIHTATETLLKEFYEVRSKYGDPFRTILKEMPKDGKKQLLTEFGYIFGNSEKEVLAKWKAYYEGRPYKKPQDSGLVTMPVAPCVIITHSFSTEGTQVHEYDSDEEAAAGLKMFFDLYLAEERSNNSKLNEAETFCEDDYAKITWAGEAGDKTEFIVSCIWKEV